MIRKEDFAVITALHQRGVFLKDIALEVGVHPRTVRRALDRGGAPARVRPPTVSKLDPHKGKVDQLLAEGVWNAKVILSEIRAAGYAGSYTILRDYIQPKRALRPGGPRCASKPRRASNCRATGGSRGAGGGGTDQGVVQRQYLGLLAAISLLVHRQSGRRAHL